MINNTIITLHFYWNTDTVILYTGWLGVLSWVQSGYCFVVRSIGYFAWSCWVQLSQQVFELVCYVKIFFSGTTQLTVYNISLQDDCLTTIAGKTVSKSLWNQALFRETSVSNYQMPGANTG